jgi:CzcA family heavy metal efflux pump
MLQRLIEFSVRRSGLVLILAASSVIYAVVVIQRLPIDVFPELNAPTVVVMSEAPGLASEEVEQYVTFRIETAVNGVPGVRRVRSASSTGLSIVWIEFDWGEDIYRARQLVSERMTAAKEGLPENVHAEITPITSITGEILLLSLSSPSGEADEIALRSFAEFDLRTRLLAVPGVAQVSPIGGGLPEYRVDARQERLLAYGLTLEDVANAARRAHSTAAGGYLADYDRLELPIRQSARVRSVDDLKKTLVVARDGAPITLDMVADVALAAAPRRGAASTNGSAAVVMSVQKSPGVNTLELTKSVDEALVSMEPTLPKGMKLDRAVFRQTDFIGRAVDNVLVVMRDAAIIVAIILVLFLLNVRTTLITLTALPLSFAAAIVALDFLGIGLNVMTLGGLAVAIGELVDDAIIDVENVFRRLKENAALPEDARKPMASVVIGASNEIRSTVVYATLLIVLVFLPMMFLEGMEGRFFRPLGVTYVASLFASLLVAVTVTPALCRLLLRGRLGSADHRDGALVRVLKRGYEATLRFTFRRGKLVAAAAILVSVGAGAVASTFGSSFLPSFNEGTYTVFLFAPPGTSLEESDRMGLGVEKRLAAIEGVRSVSRRTGRAERDEHAEPPSNSEMDVVVLPTADVARVRREIDSILEQTPGVTTEIGQPIEHRLSHILSGTPAAVAVNIFGDDLDVLRAAARELETALKALPGARDVVANREQLVPSLPIQFRPADLAVAGLTPADAAEAVERAIHGERVAEVYDGARRYDVVVRLSEDERRSVVDVENIVLIGAEGETTRLKDVADISIEKISKLVARENGRRKAVVSCNVAEGSNLGDLAEAVRRVAEPIAAKAGCFATFAGQFEAQRAATRTLTLYGGAALGIMLLLLYISTGSMRTASLVMVNLPLALVGGVAAVFFAEPGNPWANLAALVGAGGAAYRAPVLSLPSLVGFFTLFGIAVRNGILLVNHYKHLRESEGESLDGAVLRGSLERLVPILMTAISAALGLLPLAMASGKPGSELLAPLSVVVLGGLLSSTFLNLVVVPVGYAWAHRSGSTRSGDRS